MQRVSVHRESLIIIVVPPTEKRRECTARDNQRRLETRAGDSLRGFLAESSSKTGTRWRGMRLDGALLSGRTTTRDAAFAF